MAVFAAEAFDESFGVEAGVAGAEERGARDAEFAAHVGDFFAPGIGADGSAVFSESVGLDGDLVLDGFVGMIGMVQVHRVLGDGAVGGLPLRHDLGRLAPEHVGFVQDLDGYPAPVPAAAVPTPAR